MEIVQDRKRQERQKDPIAVELGRRGALARKLKHSHDERSRQQMPSARARSERERYGIAIPEWREEWNAIIGVRGDPAEYIARVWPRKIPRLWEKMMADALAGRPVSGVAFEVLKAMTLMVPSLAPARLLAGVGEAANALPSDIDLSHISTADLARLTRRSIHR
jgi:hypothetical protein